MRNRAYPCKFSAAGLPIARLQRHVDSWLLDCEIRQCSQRTLYERRRILDLFAGFLREQGAEQITALEIRQYLATFNRHGRQAKAATVASYHNHIRSFFSWCVGENLLEQSPTDGIAAPIVRSDQVQPFSLDEVRSLLDACRKSKHRARDEAMVKLLLDTGMRAAEICGLRVRDIEPSERRCRILGKGNKERSVYFGASTTRAIYQYLADRNPRHSENSPPPDPNSLVFLAEGGWMSGEGLTTSGLLHAIRRIGKRAGLKGVRCSPHTFRHTFAIEFLRSGGNQFTLMTILGHTNVRMTQRYVAIAQADVAVQQRTHSPVDKLRSVKRGKARRLFDAE